MPESRKFTDPIVKNLAAPEKGQVDYWDSLLPGFGMRISYAGTKSWMVHTRVLQKGQWKPTRITFDRYPALTLKGARAEARRLLELSGSGKDPRTARKQTIKQDWEKASRNNYTVIVEDFLKRYRTRQRKRPSPRTLKELERVLNHDAFKDWKNLPMRDISKRDIQDVIDTFMEKGHERAANAYLRYLKMLFGWALDRDIIETDPTNRIKPPGEEKSRERVLTEKEIQAIWKATAPTQKNKTEIFSSIVKILIFTGQRRNEVAGMRWSEIDFKTALWSLPASRTKNNREHLVPISRPVLEILQAQLEEQVDIGMKTELVFTSNGKTQFSGWSKSKARLYDRAKSHLEETLEPWTLHDFRRTLVTRLHEDLHIPPHIVEAIVNHVSGHKAGVAGTYNRAVYLDERRRALDAWADHVLDLIENKKQADNVVRMKP